MVRWKLMVLFVGFVYLAYADVGLSGELEDRLAQCDLIYAGQTAAVKKALACKEKILFEFPKSDPGVLFEERLARCDAAFGEGWLRAKQGECRTAWFQQCNKLYQRILPIMKRYDGMEVAYFRSDPCYKNQTASDCRHISVADALVLKSCSGFVASKYAGKALFGGAMFDYRFSESDAFCYDMVYHQASGAGVECKAWGEADSTSERFSPFLVGRTGGKPAPNWIAGNRRCQVWAKDERTKEIAYCRRRVLEKEP